MGQLGMKNLERAAGLLVLSIMVLGNARSVRGQNWGSPVWSDEFAGASGTPIDPNEMDL